MSDTFNTTLRLRQALALAIVVVVLGGTMLRSAGIGIHRIYWFQEWLGGDIAVHILMGAFLTAPVAVSEGRQRDETRRDETRRDEKRLRWQACLNR